MNGYKLRKRATACMKCDVAFEAGARIVTAIYEDEQEGFLRRDLCEACYEGAEGAFSHWRATQPEGSKEAARLDYELALRFLDRLLRDADPAREGLVYTLTLLLGRRRRVKLRGVRQHPDGEVLLALVPREEEDELVEVRAPRLTEPEIEALQVELAELFGFGTASEPDPGGEGGKPTPEGPQEGAGNATATSAPDDARDGPETP